MEFNPTNKINNVCLLKTRVGPKQTTRWALEVHNYEAIIIGWGLWAKLFSPIILLNEDPNVESKTSVLLFTKQCLGF